MEPEKQVDETGTTPETITPEPSQDPVEQEIAREKAKGEGRTEAEKAAFSLKKNADRARELGIDPLEVLGVKAEPKDDDNAPVTVGMLKEIQKETGRKTALEMADEISDPHERELTKHYLNTRVLPSGNASEDLRFARLAVNSVKNGQIAEELGRKGTPGAHASGAGAPPKAQGTEIELTAAELQFTRPPLNMTPAQIVAARPKT